LNLSPEAIADFARQVQDIVPACPVTDVPEQKRGAFAPRFVIRLSGYPRGLRRRGEFAVAESLDSVEKVLESTLTSDF
jgi:hypothetical protein